MTDKRLKEIKDSIGLQANVMQIKHLDTTIIDEELELYNEVIRLREELNGKQLQEMHKVNNYDYFKEMTENWNREDFSRRCYDLCNEQVDLQTRIDKATEYIEKNKYKSKTITSVAYGGLNIYEICCEVDDLLNILRGNDNE